MVDQFLAPSVQLCLSCSSKRALQGLDMTTRRRTDLLGPRISSVPCDAPCRRSLHLTRQAVMPANVRSLRPCPPPLDNAGRSPGWSGGAGIARPRRGGKLDEISGFRGPRAASAIATPSPPTPQGLARPCCAQGPWELAVGAQCWCSIQRRARGSRISESCPRWCVWRMDGESILAGVGGPVARRRGGVVAAGGSFVPAIQGASQGRDGGGRGAMARNSIDVTSSDSPASLLLAPHPIEPLRCCPGRPATRVALQRLRNADVGRSQSRPGPAPGRASLASVDKPPRAGGPIWSFAAFGSTRNVRGDGTL